MPIKEIVFTIKRGDSNFDDSRDVLESSGLLPGTLLRVVDSEIRPNPGEYVITVTAVVEGEADDRSAPLTLSDMADMLDRGATIADVCVAVVKWGFSSARPEPSPMDKTTHAKITVNDQGETEVRQLDVVGESEPESRHRLASIEVKVPVQTTDDSRPAS